MLRSRHAATTLTLVATCALFVACTYDFDKYVKSSAGGGQAGAATTGGVGGAGANASGRGGASGSAGSRAGSGNAGRGGTSSAEAGMGGQGDGGDGGAGEPGGRGGSSGRGAGGAGGTGGTAGSAAGGGGSGGSSSGRGGSTASGGAGSPSGGAGSSGGGAGGAGGAPGVDCDALGGDVWGGHCYFLIDALRWEAARDECASHGGASHLVTITSADEQAFIAASFFPSDDDLWIGLSLEEPDDDAPSLCKLDSDLCPFLWVTGEALDYTDWAEHSSSDVEPNFTGPCTRLQADDQLWADRGCEGTAIPAICESGG